MASQKYEEEFARALDVARCARADKPASKKLS
jgi:hypothetical protein